MQTEFHYLSIAVGIPINKSLIYKNNINLEIGSCVFVEVRGREEIGIVLKNLTQDDLQKEQIPPDKIKNIKSVINYKIENNYINFINAISTYNMQNLGSVVDAVSGNIKLLTEKSRISKKKDKDLNQFAKINLSQDQLNISDQIWTKCNQFNVNLINGVTGSGKTLVFLEIVEKILKQESDSQVLICLPEIGLTPQTKEFFENIIGIKASLWHSSITKAEKKKILRNITDGTERVLIGTRSSILVQFKNLKLIVIDEEHDQSYKQNDMMIYSARDMAIMRAKIYNIPLILSSATPSIETYYNCLNQKYNLFKLEKRHSDIQMPEIKIVDLLKKDNKPIPTTCISPLVIETAKEIINSDHQVLFFLNKRGYSSSIVCKDCKSFVECQNCSVNMAYHKEKNILKCHYCGYSSKIPTICPACKKDDAFIKIGFGVERVNDELQKHFPDTKIQIFSSDIVNKSNIQEVTENILTGETNIIIGTQMISKGYNFPKLKCVVIVDTDTGFLDGDFRIYEKTYQIITQVGGRAGRFGEKGLVLIQTYQPENPAIKSIVNSDFNGFYEGELKRRNVKNNPLPPFARQVAIIISSNDEERAIQASSFVAKVLHKEISHIAKIFGPAESLIKRVNRQFRYRILISIKKDAEIMNKIRNIIMGFNIKSDVMIKIDVDPVNFI